MEAVRGEKAICAYMRNEEYGQLLGVKLLERA